MECKEKVWGEGAFSIFFFVFQKRKSSSGRKTTTDRRRYPAKTREGAEAQRNAQKTRRRRLRRPGIIFFVANDIVDIIDCLHVVVAPSFKRSTLIYWLVPPSGSMVRFHIDACASLSSSLSLTTIFASDISLLPISDDVIACRHLPTADVDTTMLYLSLCWRSTSIDMDRSRHSAAAPLLNDTLETVLLTLVLRPPPLLLLSFCWLLALHFWFIDWCVLIGVLLWICA